MASHSNPVGQCQRVDGSMSRNTNSTSTPAPSRSGPVPSSQPDISMLDRPFANSPPTNPIDEPQRPTISPGIVRGLHLLGLDIPRSITAKVAVAYTDMLPMERFLAETCNVDGGAHVQGVVSSSKTLSCQANAGSFKSE
ncbi:hypothetical protein Neosp_012065 [[Neocosmospora] mangrovei]